MFVTAHERRSTSVIYNKRLDEWTSDNAPDLPQPLYMHSVVPINRERTKFLLVGGMGVGTDRLDTAYVYDWVRKIWTDTGNVPIEELVIARSIYFKGNTREQDKVCS